MTMTKHSPFNLLPQLTVVSLCWAVVLECGIRGVTPVMETPAANETLPHDGARVTQRAAGRTRAAQVRC